MILRLLPKSIITGDAESAMADNLYAGYIKAQETVNRRLEHHDGIIIPLDIDFRALDGLSHEMVERLERCRPLTFGEARTIPGLTPAALSTLYVAAAVSRQFHVSHKPPGAPMGDT
jgi:tRNA uridine 5-carboxymethylaminomethyl modification enzyme